MPIFQQGQLNTAALTVPNLYVQIAPPGIIPINGVPTNKIGIVGTAVWGPVGVATLCAGNGDCQANFGPLQNRKYDLGTQVAGCVTQGASSFAVVRATDGTDNAAAVIIGALGLITTARYTGTLGNTIQVSIATGSRGTGYWKLTVSIGGGNTTLQSQLPEVYDNLGYGLTGNALLVAFAAALNNGTSPQRPTSRLVVASVGSGTSAPVIGTTTLTGGTDGASTPSAVAATPTIIYGTDTAPRTGIFALRNQGCSLGIVADMDTPAAWTAIDALAQQEAIYFIQTGPAGDTIANAVTTVQTAGLASPWSKMMFGDWVWWVDGVNAITRLISPQSWIAGKMAMLGPNNTTLNKTISGMSGTQKSGVVGTQQAQSYASADLASLVAAGISVIGNPSPGGAYFSDLIGHNTSVNQGIQSDSYTRMTDFIATTLNAGMGQYVGSPITPALENNVIGTLNQFLGNLVLQGYLAVNSDGSMPYTVECDTGDNPQSRTSIGYLQADVQVTYEGIAEKFIVNFTGGAGVVTMTPATNP